MGGIEGGARHYSVSLCTFVMFPHVPLFDLLTGS